MHMVSKLDKNWVDLDLSDDEKTYVKSATDAVHAILQKECFPPEITSRLKVEFSKAVRTLTPKKNAPVFDFTLSDDELEALYADSNKHEYESFEGKPFFQMTIESMEPSLGPPASFIFNMAFYGMGQYENVYLQTPNSGKGLMRHEFQHNVLDEVIIVQQAVTHLAKNFPIYKF